MTTDDVINDVTLVTPTVIKGGGDGGGDAVNFPFVLKGNADGDD